MIPLSLSVRACQCCSEVALGFAVVICTDALTLFQKHIYLQDIELWLFSDVRIVRDSLGKGKLTSEVLGGIARPVQQEGDIVCGVAVLLEDSGERTIVGGGLDILVVQFDANLTSFVGS